MWVVILLELLNGEKFATFYSHLQEKSQWYCPKLIKDIQNISTLIELAWNFGNGRFFMIYAKVSAAVASATLIFLGSPVPVKYSQVAVVRSQVQNGEVLWRGY